MEPVQDLTDVADVRVSVIRKDQNIIEVRHAEVVEKSSQRLVDVILEGRRCIGQAER